MKSSKILAQDRNERTSGDFPEDRSDNTPLSLLLPVRRGPIPCEPRTLPTYSSAHPSTPPPSSQPCSKLFEKHQHLLQAVYCFFRTGGRKKTLMLDGWLAVCDAAGWTTRPEMSGFDAKLVFMWSQMCISNEVTNRTRLVSLTWIEFLEAIGRVSEIFFPLGPRAKAGAFCGAGTARN